MESSLIMTLKLIVKKMTGVFGMYTGINKLIGLARMRNKACILMYHSVGDPSKDPLGMTVSVADFERQIAYFKEFYTALSLDDVVEICYTKKKIPSRTIVVTFDDGFRDNYENAFPVLKRNKIPATVFLTTDLIGTERLLWFDEVVELVGKTEKKRIVLKKMPQGCFETRSEGQKRSVAVCLVGYLKKVDDNKRQELIEELRVASEVTDLSDSHRLLLTWEQVREMSAAGITFGSHGASHRILSRVYEDEALDRELRWSKQMIEEQTNKAVTLFSYPNSTPDDFTRDTVARLKKASYRAVCTTREGLTEGTDDPFYLKRKGIDHESSAGLSGTYDRSVFDAEMSGLYEAMLLRNLRKRLRV